MSPACTAPPAPVAPVRSADADPSALVTRDWCTRMVSLTRLACEAHLRQSCRAVDCPR